MEGNKGKDYKRRDKIADNRFVKTINKCKSRKRNILSASYTNFTIGNPRTISKKQCFLQTIIYPFFQSAKRNDFLYSKTLYGKDYIANVGKRISFIGKIYFGVF